VVECYATATVSGHGGCGVLIGHNHGYLGDCYATGNVTGGDRIGGLVGCNGGTISDCYATCTVTRFSGYSSYFVGGLVGDNTGTVRRCHSGGSVDANSGVGGLLGVSLASATLSDSYTTATVTGNTRVGGLVGWVEWSTVTRCYAVGTVEGNTQVGGLVGICDYGIVSDSFWDTETSGQATSAGGTGKTTAEVMDIATFSGATWDIVAVATPDTRNTSYIWNVVDEETYPFLSWQAVS
jgi:trimeric autotransporter adhesin